MKEAGVMTCDSYEKYLGLPVFVRRSKYNAFQSIKERIWGKIQNWKTSFLSKAEKEVMIKAVLQAIPTYTMGVFLLPRRLCIEIEGLFSRFWWSQGQNETSIHWRKWSEMGMLKLKGGLGFRSLANFNMAMLAKQGWRLLKDPQSLVAKIYKEKYYKHMKVLEAKLGKSPSLIWRSVWTSMEVLRE